MRRLVGMLRQDGDDELSPQPGLDDSRSFRAQVREAGLPVELTFKGEQATTSGRDRALRLPDRPGGADERAQARGQRDRAGPCSVGEDTLELESSTTAPVRRRQSQPAAATVSPACANGWRCTAAASTQARKPAAASACACSSPSDDRHPDRGRPGARPVSGSTRSSSARPRLHHHRRGRRRRRGRRTRQHRAPDVVLMESACRSSTASKRPAGSSPPDRRPCPDPDDVRPRQVRVRLPARRRERLPAQRRPAGGDLRRSPHHRPRRSTPCAGSNTHRHRGIRTHASAANPRHSRRASPS